MIFTKSGSLICALALGLVNLLAVSRVVHGGSTNEFDQFYFHLRPRLGHFSRADGYLKIYEEYFANTLKQTDKAMEQVDINDWRNVRPSGEFCIDFLQEFQVRSYSLNKPFDIIPLDACLEWLMDNSDEKEVDVSRFNVVTKEEMFHLRDDHKLPHIYQSTLFKGDKIPMELKEKLHEYFAKLLKIYSNNPRNGCHSFWMEAYNDFVEDVYLADCDDEDACVHFGLDGSDNDSYLNLIIESTKQAAKTCYSVMQRQMTGLMHAAYDAESIPTSITRKLKVKSNKVAKQSEAMKWSIELIKILQLVSGLDADTPINLADAVEDLRKIKRNDPATVQRFTDALSKYAMDNVNLKDSANDATGRARFGRAMTKFCRPYIDSKSFLAQTGGSTLWEDPADTKKPFEFYHLIYSIVKLTNHVQIYGITKDQFEEDVMKYGWESLYLATFACQIISTTWGQLDYDTNTDIYKVYLRPNAQVLIEDWPISVMSRRLAELYPRSGRRAELAPGDKGKNRENGTKLKFKLPAFSIFPENQVRNHEERAPIPPMPAQTTPPPPPPPALLVQPQAAPAPPAKPTPQPVAPMVTMPAPKVAMPAPKARPQVPSLENILLFKELHGRYPQLPASIHQIYPSLPKDLTRTNQKREEPERKSARRQEPERPLPLAFDFDQDFKAGEAKYSDQARTGNSNGDDNAWANLNAMSM